MIFEGLRPKSYRVILADPPWKFSSGPSRNPKNHYDCMAIKDIAALPVKDLAHPDGSRLLCWTTLPMLEHTFGVIKQWGFRYSTARVWVKHYNGVIEGRFEPQSFARGTGYEVIGNPEVLVIAKTGKPERLGNKKPFALIFGPRREHSRKPDNVRQEIVELFKGPRCELFARSPQVGFDSWGNETEKFREAA